MYFISEIYYIDNMNALSNRQKSVSSRSVMPIVAFYFGSVVPLKEELAIKALLLIPSSNRHFIA